MIILKQLMIFLRTNQHHVLVNYKKHVEDYREILLIIRIMLIHQQQRRIIYIIRIMI